MHQLFWIPEYFHDSSGIVRMAFPSLTNYVIMMMLGEHSSPLHGCNQRYLMVNLDKHSMNKITLTSNKKAKTGGKRDLRGCNKKERECQKLLKTARIVLSCS